MMKPWNWTGLAEPIGAIAAEIAKKGISKGAEGIAARAAEVWRGFKWDEAEEKYRQRLLSRVRTTKILGNPKPISVDDIYTDVYVLTKISSSRRFQRQIDDESGDSSHILNENKRERKKAAELIAGGRSTYILGRPGAGKTTFLRHLAINACRGLNVRTPIFVTIKDWSDSRQSLLEYTLKEFEGCGFPDARLFLNTILQRGNVLFLLDGLDEVNEADDKRSQVIKEVVAFSNKYSGNQYCMTCRIAATDYSFEHFDYVEVADFNNIQKNRFIEQWYKEEKVKLERFKSAWKKEDNSGLRELGKTPLLLALICLAFDETLAFPRRQVDLYREALDALLRKWDTSRLIVRDGFYAQMSFVQRQQLLENIAATLYFDSKITFDHAELVSRCHKFLKLLPSSEAQTDGTAEEIIRQIESQHGLLIEVARKLYSFSHLTIQEYLTACFISTNQNDNLRRQIIKSGLTDKRWYEVIKQTVAIVSNADAFLDEMRRQLLALKKGDSGVMILLAYAFVDAVIERPGELRSYQRSRANFVELKEKIEGYVENLRHPSLSSAEFARLLDYVNVLHDFLAKRSDKLSLVNSNHVCRSLLRMLIKNQKDISKLLGGYFVDSGRFLEFFYGCRIFIECLEVGITSRRDEYMTGLLDITDQELQSVNEKVSAYGTGGVTGNA